MQTILVCDDDKQIVEAINIYLTGEGFEVIKAYDGYEALEYLEDHEVNLMIVDVMMPGLDGIRTTRLKTGWDIKCFLAAPEKLCSSWTAITYSISRNSTGSMGSLFSLFQDLFTDLLRSPAVCGHSRVRRRLIPGPACFHQLFNIGKVHISVEHRPVCTPLHPVKDRLRLRR